MFIESLQSHLAVCAQPELPAWAKSDPDFWNLISIREGFRPTIDRTGFREVHSTIFNDVVGLDGLAEDHTFILPQARHLKAMFSFTDSLPGEPVLVHCWAGESRSTAVALALIARAMYLDGYEHSEIVAEAPGLLIEIRGKASPNPLVLQLGLEQFLPKDEAFELLKGMLNSDRLFANRFGGASPGCN